MKLNSYIVKFLLCFLLLPGLLSAQDVEPVEKPDGPVYVLPIEGQIENALIYVVRRGLQEADARNAAALVIKMHTPGGAVNSTEEICRLLRGSQIPLYTLVDGNGISAGAIIALTTPTIYMTPGSKIGDAMPIAMGQQLGEAEREKVESYVDGLMRSNTEFSGRDSGLGTAMVRRNFEYKIGDEIISPEGQLLTLTNGEAERLVGDPPRPLLSKGTVEDLNEMLEREGLANREMIELVPTGLEKVARFIAALAPLLMMIGLAMIYLEFQTPGFGIPALTAAFCLFLFFFGHHIAGLSGSEDVLIFLIGICLILVELFVIPGFGVVGVIGGGLIVVSLLSAMVERMPGQPVLPSWELLQGPVANLSMALGATAVLITLMVRYLPGHGPFRQLVLGTTLARTPETPAGGAFAVGVRVGDCGRASTDLHPGGSARFAERKLDVVTRGEYIAAGQPVCVAELHGSRVVVEKAPTEEA